MPEFERLNSLVPPSESAWPAIKERFLVGTGVTGVVIARQPFGAFIDLGEGALALMERPSMPWRPDAHRMVSPDVGTAMTGTVIDYMKNNRRIRLVAPDPWSAHPME